MLYSTHDLELEQSTINKKYPSFPFVQLTPHNKHSDHIVLLPSSFLWISHFNMDKHWLLLPLCKPPPLLCSLCATLCFDRCLSQLLNVFLERAGCPLEGHCATGAGFGHTDDNCICGKQHKYVKRWGTELEKKKQKKNPKKKPQLRIRLSLD